MKKLALGFWLALPIAGQSMNGVPNQVVRQQTAVSLASAATTDLGSVAPGVQSVSITGTTMITSFGSTAPVGTVVNITFAGAAPVQGGATLKLAAATNMLWPAVGDAMTCSVPAAAGSWVCGAVSSSIARSADDQTANLTPAALTHWRAALARVRARAGRAKVIFLTDSTGIGTGAGSGGTTALNGAEPFSLVRSFAMLGTTSATPVHQDSFYGESCVATNASVDYGTFDTRVTLGSGWGVESSADTLGGSHFFKFTNGAGGTLSFTPAGAFDTIKLYYVHNGLSAMATVNVDGGASLGTLSQVGSYANITTTYTVTPGTHTVNVVPDNTGTFYLAGIETYNSSTPAVDIVQGSCWGVVAANSISNATGVPWDPYQTLAYLAPDLTVVDVTINDVNTGTALASYVASVQSIITQAKLSGDVVLMVGAPSSAAQSVSNTNGALDTLIAALAELARANNVVLLNTKARWTSFAAANAVMPYYDNVHPGKAGYADLGQFLAEKLLR